MLVLHATWSKEAGLLLWAEDSSLPVTSPSEAVRRAREHPFSASAAQLRALIGGEGIVDGESTRAVVHVPSLRRAPLDSAELVRIQPRPAGRVAPSLLTWTVPAIGFDPARLARQHEDVDARPGASLRFVAGLAEFADDLVRRGRVLPSLSWTDAAHAHWRAALTGSDAVRAHALISSMPPSFRAASPDDAPSTLGTAVLNELVDARVRDRLTTSFLPRRRGRKPATTPTAEAWLDALTGTDSVIHADPDAITDLHDRLAEWDGFGTHDPGPAMLVLRLTEPPVAAVGIVLSAELAAGLDEVLQEVGAAEPAGSETTGTPERSASDWTVQFLLRSRTDPSLLVDAAAVWGGDGGLERWLRSPREVLLSELARAQRVYPELERALRAPRPDALTLDVEGAHRFLAEAAVALDEAGVEVQLPGWWSRKRRVGLRLSATPSDGDEGEEGFDRYSIADFRWDLALGDHGLTDEEIAALAAAKAPLVQLRGEWVAVDQDRLRRGIEFVSAYGSGQMPVRRVIELALSHPDDTDLPLELDEIDAGGWLGELLQGTASVADIAPPDGFLATLRPYQQRGLSWLAFLGRLGSGRCARRRHGARQDRAAAGAGRRPAERAPRTGPPCCSARCRWSATGSGRRAAVHAGAARCTCTTARTGRAGDELRGATRRRRPGRHHLRDGAARHRRAAPDPAGTGSCWTRRRPSRTPVASRPRRCGDWMPAAPDRADRHPGGEPARRAVVDHGLRQPRAARRAEQFRDRYADPDRADGDDRRRRSGCARITRPFVLRRLKTDQPIIDDLPEKLEMKQSVQPHRRAGLAVPGRGRRHAGAASRTAEGIERRGLVLATMTKLKQVCNHPAQLLRRRLAHRPAGPASWPGSRRSSRRSSPRATRRCCFTQYAEFGAMLRPHLAGAVRPRGAVPARRHAADRRATRWWRASRPTTARRSSCCRSRRAAPG